MTYREAMERYGTDKPDLRFGMEFQDLTDLLQAADFRLFQQTRGTGGADQGYPCSWWRRLSRRELDELADVARAAGAAGALGAPHGRRADRHVRPRAGRGPDAAVH